VAMLSPKALAIATHLARPQRDLTAPATVTNLQQLQDEEENHFLVFKVLRNYLLTSAPF